MTVGAGMTKGSGDDREAVNYRQAYVSAILFPTHFLVAPIPPSYLCLPFALPLLYIDKSII